jgi:excisionase family DNA binding protein
MSVRDAAERYGVSQATLYNLLRRGELHRFRRSGDKKTYLKIEELDRVLRPRPVEEDS